MEYMCTILMYINAFLLLCIDITCYIRSFIYYKH